MKVSFWDSHDPTQGRVVWVRIAPEVQNISAFESDFLNSEKYGMGAATAYVSNNFMP